MSENESNYGDELGKAFITDRVALDQGVESLGCRARITATLHFLK